MKIVPREEYRIETPLSKEEAASVLRVKTTKEKYLFGHINTEKLFRGEVYDDSFKFSRIIQGRNSFLPVIRGKILECGKGAEVVMEFTVDPSVSAFYICWLFFCGIFFLIALFAGIANHNFSPVVIIPLFMVCFGYGLTKLSFNYEASKMKKILKHLLIANCQ